MAFSGHKLYAPFGAGVLVGPAGHLRRRRPLPGRRGRGRPRRPRRGVVDRAPRAGGGGIAQRDRGRRPRGRPRRAGPHRLGRPSRPTSRPWPAGCGTAWPPSTACACSAPSLDTDTLAIAAFVVEGVRPRPGGGPAERRVGHRRPPRLLLRPPLPRPPPRSVTGRRRRLPGAGARGRPPVHARRGAGQLRDLDHRSPTSTPCSTPSSVIAAQAGVGRGATGRPTSRTPTRATSGP